jgi:hypothetical protein
MSAGNNDVTADADVAPDGRLGAEMVANIGSVRQPRDLMVHRHS